MQPRLRVVGGGDADEDAGLRAAQFVGWNAGVLDRFPRQLEKQSLLRIERHRLERRDAEERGVECVHVVVEESARARVRLSCRVGIRVEELVNVPS